MYSGLKKKNPVISEPLNFEISGEHAPNPSR